MELKNGVVAIIVLSALPSILVSIWFHKGLLFGGGEEGIPFYNLNRTYQLSLPMRSTDGGYSNNELVVRIPFYYLSSLLMNLGIKNNFLQASLFYILMSTGMISMYFLLCFTFISKVNNVEKINIEIEKIPLIGANFTYSAVVPTKK